MDDVTEQPIDTAAAQPTGGAEPTGIVVDTPPPPKSSREEIYARHSAQRASDISDDPERHAAVSALAGRTSEQVADAAGEAAVATTDDKGVALDPKVRMFAAKVEGNDVEFPENEVIEAGIRALQKDSSADLKLRRASAAEQQAVALLADAKKQAQGGLPSSGARHDDASSRPSEQDDGESAEATARAAAEQARTVLFDEGDPDKAAKVMVDSSRKAVVAETNRMFRTEFSDIASDPDAFRRAAQLMNAELQKNPSFARIPVIASRIGNQIRTEQLAASMQTKDAGADGGGKEPQATNQQQQQASTGAQSRADTKVRLPVMPSRATTKTTDTTPVAKPTRQTPSQIVQNMRVARGQVRA